MATIAKPASTIRLWAENLKMLEPLSEAGLNVSEIANEILRDNLKPETVREHLDRKIKRLRKAMANV